jgi:hypothetical protein
VSVDEIIATTIRLLTAGGAPLWAVVLLAIVAAIVISAAKHLGTWKPIITPSEPPLNPGQPIGSGEGGGVVDSAGNAVTSDPDNPGGGPTGGMG